MKRDTKMLLIILLVVVIVVIIFALINTGIFTKKISDCKITNVNYPKEIDSFQDFNISVAVSNFGNKGCMIWEIWIPELYKANLSINENLFPKETQTYIISTNGTGTIGGKAFQIIVRYYNQQQEDNIESGFMTFNR